MQDWIKKIIKIWALGLALKLWAAYTFSDKIGYVKNDVCQELSDSLWKKEILCNQETNDIINLMSGKISQQDFNALLARHGYKNTTINIEKLIKPDEALYKTILEIQTKYTNPTISFSGSFYNIETGKDEPERPRHNMFTNAMQLHQLDAKILQFKTMNQEDKFRTEHMFWLKSFLKSYAQETRQRYLLNNRKTETTHMREIKEEWATAVWFDLLAEWICSWFNWKKMYNTKWDVEWRAHIIYEPELIKDIIETYKKYADLENPEQVFMLAKFYGGFFTLYEKWLFVPYTDNKQTAFYLNMLENMWHDFSSYLMWCYYQGIYAKEYKYNLYGCNYVQDTLKVDIHWDTITRVELFEKFIFYYEKSYRQWNIEAGYDILYIINAHRRGQYDELVLNIWRDMINHHQDELESAKLAETYKILWSVYFHKWNKKKWEKYYKIANKILAGTAQ